LAKRESVYTFFTNRLSLVAHLTPDPKRDRGIQLPPNRIWAQVYPQFIQATCGFAHSS